MVSIRRRKLTGHCTGRRSSLVVLPSVPDSNVPRVPEQMGKPVNVCRVPLSEHVEDKEEKDTLADPPPKKQKIHVQVDPENPIEVHSYLMQLKEDKKLELGPKQRSEQLPVKEWMESCYPHIFRVFPQDPKVFSECSDKSKQNEVLYCQYCLFLFVLRNIVLIDCSVSSDHVESLGGVIKNLEKQGFDCKFLRSELVVVGNMMKLQLEITMSVKNVISTRIIKLEKELQAAAIMKEKEAKLNKGGREMEGIKPEIEALPMQVNKLQDAQIKDQKELTKYRFPALEQDYIKVILESHKKVLEYKEEEGKRLGRVLEKISQLYRGKHHFLSC